MKKSMLLSFFLALALSSFSQLYPNSIDDLAPTGVDARPFGFAISCDEIKIETQGNFGAIYERNLFSGPLMHEKLGNPYQDDAQCTPQTNMRFTHTTVPNVDRFIYRLGYTAGTPGAGINFIPGEYSTNNPTIKIGDLQPGKYFIVQTMGVPTTLSCLTCADNAPCQAVLPVYNINQINKPVVGGTWAGGQFDRVTRFPSNALLAGRPWRLIQVGVPQPEFNVPETFSASESKTIRVDLSRLNSSTNPWSSVRFDMCKEDTNGECKIWTSTGWLNDSEMYRLLIHGAKNFQPYLEDDIWRFHHKGWALWPGNYRIKLVLKTNECDGWEALEKSFTVLE